MTLEELPDDGNPSRHRRVRQANDAGKSKPTTMDEGTEVLVHGDQDAPVGQRSFEHRRVAGVGPCVRDLGDVVTLGTQPSGQAAAGAGIDEESHSAATLTSSMRSPAIAAWA